MIQFLSATTKITIWLLKNGVKFQISKLPTKEEDLTIIKFCKQLEAMIHKEDRKLQGTEDIS